MKRTLKKEIGCFLLIAVLVLVGYHPLFSGSSFFVDGDSVTVFDYQHGNAIGNGWRPDKGLGISFFFGDPGMYHAWSIYTLLEKVFASPVGVYNVSIILLLMLAAICLYFFLSVVVKGNKWVNALLSLLLVFGSLQHEFFFQRHWITLSIGTPLILFLLKSFFDRKEFSHYIALGLLFWFTVMFGGSCAFFQLAFLGLLFTILYCRYHRPSLVKVCKDYAMINLVGISMMFALGAWVFYSLFLEGAITGYVREHVFAVDWKLFDVKLVPFFLFRFLHAGLLPYEASLPYAIEIIRGSISYPSVIAPMICVLVLFFKPKNFWHYLVKWMTVIFIVNEFLNQCSPCYASVTRLLLAKIYHFAKFQPSYHCFMIAFIGIFMENLDDFFNLNKKVLYFVKGLAWLLTLMYLSLAALMVIVFINPDSLSGGLDILNKVAHLAEGRMVFLKHVVQFFAQQLRYSIHWYTIPFYLLSAFLVYLFTNFSLLKRIVRHKIVFASLLVINSFFLSWTIYPLRKEPLVWHHPYYSKKSQSRFFKDTDRFYSFFSYQKKSRNLEDFQDKWKVDEKGVVKKLVGFRKLPPLSLSGVKSYTQKDVAGLINKIFSPQNSNIKYIDSLRKIPLKELRDLIMGPVVVSPLIDMLAVNYYYTTRAYPEMFDTLELVSDKDAIIYRNKNAWPYYYLAEDIRPLNEGMLPSEPQKGVAYVDAKDVFDLKRKGRGTEIRLREFGYGQMNFRYQSNRENFLVIADAWHPFWKAKKDDGEFLSIIKANKIFKGIKLPPGRYDVKVYYDTLPYRPGIYIAMVSWVILGAVLVIRKRFELKKRQ